MYVFHVSNNLSKYLEGQFSLNWKCNMSVKKFTKAFLCYSNKFNSSNNNRNNDRNNNNKNTTNFILGP